MEASFVFSLGSFLFHESAVIDCRLPCRGSRNHHRPVCTYSPHTASGFPFCLWLCSFRFCDSAAHLLVCRAKEMAGIAASFIHVLPRLPFYLWLKLYSSCESAVAPFPCLPCGKVLATVIGIRSLPSEEMVDSDFLQSRGLSLF